MTNAPLNHSPLHQLRFVFENSTPLLRYVPAVTSGDVARIWNEIAELHPEPPVAIDITFAPRAAEGCAKSHALVG